LIIGTQSGGISINATGFNILGKLTAGSEQCHIATPITITLHGKRPSAASTNPPSSTLKGIVVSGKGSKLSLHGQRFYQTWTRLAKSVEIGQKVLMIQEHVNWQIGQKIVLVTSTIKDARDSNQNEILTISNINHNPPQSLGVGTIVYVSESVKHRHIANEYYQVEVALLSRSIKIQGSSDDSEPSDPDPGNCRDPDYYYDESIYYETTQPCMNTMLTGFGGHIRIEGNATAQVQGIELFQMGQTNVKGRYPFHFHLLGTCPMCYFKASSIHRSYYRCIAIHGTHDSLTTENVAFDVMGYCYYLEDGVEERNTISYNLAAHIHTIGPEIVRGFGQKTSQYVEGPKLTLPADVTASGFYVTNVHNNIIGNAASGVSESCVSSVAFDNHHTNVISFVL
jgi:G8 domain